ncbi:MAPEG family protein [Alkalinema sp. FACHB-956]|uniref:MAPEG family protein n=1 Tax=Alkalinema sp. FACHB-956 TaxID=2692768 RepID=UPI00168461BD|nr:MAPEG family protein [Alkalinema sp. FACHB-956]MBD2326269.1 MAPEG family protein [Alkalinema sp. FACHB-956]
MNQTTIFSPFLAMILLTFLVWVYMYIRRIRFITHKKIRPQDLATSSSSMQNWPMAVTTPSNNLKNLFEMPVLFYAIVLYLFVTQQVDSLYVKAAWFFVGFRILHSIVHCTFNLILLRFYLYLFSSIAVWFIVGRAALKHLAF